MVEMSLSKAANSLDSKLSEVKSVLNDEALNGLYEKSKDVHYRKDIEGIRCALNGDFGKAANILLSENDFIKQHPGARAVKENNGIIAMATTMCAVSLLKLGQADEAERLLRQEQQLDATGVNNTKMVKEINVEALRVALLQQGKHGEAELLGKLGSTVREVPSIPIKKNQIDEIGTKMLQEIDRAKRSPRFDIAVAMEKTETKLRACDAQLKALQQEFQRSNDKVRKEELRTEYDKVLNAHNVEAIWKLELEGIKRAFDNDYENAEGVLKTGTALVDKCDAFRRVYPEVSQSASSLYAYTLLALMKYSEAEQRFRMEIQRDRTGGNTSDSEFRQFNELGLQFALLRQGKYEEASRIGNSNIGAFAAPAPRAVLFR